MMSNKPRTIFLAGIFLILVVIAISYFKVPDSAPKEPFKYTVEAGETCTQIADAFKVPVKVIIEQNGLTPDCNLLPGQELLIPAP
jgi:LysM repeat protein